MAHKMTDIVATRIVTRTTNKGVKIQVRVSIGLPIKEQPEIEGSAWICPIQILGIGDHKVRVAFGVDAVQALYMALVLAGILLSTSSHAKELESEASDNYGFPLPRDEP